MSRHNRHFNNDSSHPTRSPNPDPDVWSLLVCRPHILPVILVEVGAGGYSFHRLVEAVLALEEAAGELLVPAGGDGVVSGEGYCGAVGLGLIPDLKRDDTIGAEPEYRVRRRTGRGGLAKG